jgi:hypothetical protein
VISPAHLSGMRWHSLRQLLIHFSNRQAPSPVFFIEAPGRPVFFSPPDTRGWRARGRCRRRFKIRISLRKCGSASRRATRTSLKCPGSFAAVFFRFAHSRKRNACAGPRFPGRRPDRGFPPIRGCREYPPGLPSFLAASPARNCGQASTAAPSASSWRAARIGHQAEPRRRPSAWEERSSPARGRRIRLHHQTPHDDAPRSSRTQCDYYPIGIKSRGRIVHDRTHPFGWLVTLDLAPEDKFLAPCDRTPDLNPHRHSHRTIARPDAARSANAQAKQRHP